MTIKLQEYPSQWNSFEESEYLHGTFFADKNYFANEFLKKKQLIADYKSVAKSKKAQKEVAIWDESLNDAWLRPIKTKKDE